VDWNIPKSFILWDTTTFILLKHNQRFGETCSLHLELEEQTKQLTSMKQAGRKLCLKVSSARFLMIEVELVLSSCWSP
jgi:hypothetical protein